jgi:hypothetical protein
MEASMEVSICSLNHFEHLLIVMNYQLINNELNSGLNKNELIVNME